MYMFPIPNGFRDRAISLYRRATRHVLRRVAKCIDVDGGIFENVLYYVNCTNFVTRIINTGIRNSKQNLFRMNNFELYNVISETVRNRTHVHIQVCLECPIL
jgi:hypothetical protein